MNYSEKSQIVEQILRKISTIKKEATLFHIRLCDDKDKLIQPIECFFNEQDINEKLNGKLPKDNKKNYVFMKNLARHIESLNKNIKLKIRVENCQNILISGHPDFKFTISYKINKENKRFAFYIELKRIGNTLNKNQKKWIKANQEEIVWVLWTGKTEKNVTLQIKVSQKLLKKLRIKKILLGVETWSEFLEIIVEDIDSEEEIDKKTKIPNRVEYWCDIK